MVSGLQIPMFRFPFSRPSAFALNTYMWLTCGQKALGQMSIAWCNQPTSGQGCRQQTRPLDQRRQPQKKTEVGRVVNLCPGLREFNEDDSRTKTRKVPGKSRRTDHQCSRQHICFMPINIINSEEHISAHLTSLKLGCVLKSMVSYDGCQPGKQPSSPGEDVCLAVTSEALTT